MTQSRRRFDWSKCVAGIGLAMLAFAAVGVSAGAATTTPGASKKAAVNVTGSPSVTITLNGSSSSATTLAVTQSLPIAAVVTGAAPHLSFSVDGIMGGNTLVGTIAGVYPHYRFVAPAAIPGNDNTVTIVAAQSGGGQPASLTVTITPQGYAATGHPTPITVAGSSVTDIDFSLTSTPTTLALADVGTCVGGACTASVTGIEVSASGRATNSCPAGRPSVCNVWLAGQGLTDVFGDPTEGMNITVSGSDVEVDGGALYGMVPSGGFSSVTFNINVSATAAPGLRNIVVTLGSGANRQTQVYVGAIQVVN